MMKPFIDSLLPVRADYILELDEIWSFVQSKSKRVWIWIALCRQTKQVIAYHLGDRTKKSFQDFYHKFPADYAGCKSHSDGLEHYKNISKYWHTCSKKKGGRTSQVEAFNTILRQRLSRLVRKTCAFSKSFEMHENIIRWFIQEYNYKIKSVKS